METKPERDGDAKTGTDLVVQQPFKSREILATALGRTLRSSDGSVSDGSGEQSLPTEVRRVRRGKFFLSRYEQTMHGSISKPIFEHWGHGVVVGEMIGSPDNGLEDGTWCFAAHNDFDLIPEFQPPSSWPEYIRTPTGWVRKDGDRRLEAPSSTLEKLMDWNMKQLRLK